MKPVETLDYTFGICNSVGTQSSIGYHGVGDGQWFFLVDGSGSGSRQLRVSLVGSCWVAVATITTPMTAGGLGETVLVVGTEMGCVLGSGIYLGFCGGVLVLDGVVGATGVT